MMGSDKEQHLLAISDQKAPLPTRRTAMNKFFLFQCNPLPIFKELWEDCCDLFCKDSLSKLTHPCPSSNMSRLQFPSPDKFTPFSHLVLSNIEWNKEKCNQWNQSQIQKYNPSGTVRPSGKKRSPWEETPMNIPMRISCSDRICEEQPSRVLSTIGALLSSIMGQVLMKKELWPILFTCRVALERTPIIRNGFHNLQSSSFDAFAQDDRICDLKLTLDHKIRNKCVLYRLAGKQLCRFNLGTILFWK